MVPDFEIACPTLDDVPAMAALHVRCWQQAYCDIFPASVLDTLSVERRIAGWTRTLNDPAVYAPAARVAGTWIGFMHCGPTRHDSGAGEIYGIYVDASQYRSGIGRHLLELAFANLRGCGFADGVVCTLTDNVRARRFYEAMGGTLIRDDLKFSLEGVDYPEVMYRFTL